jgi:hypothetical protein
MYLYCVLVAVSVRTSRSRRQRTTSGCTRPGPGLAPDRTRDAPLVHVQRAALTPQSQRARARAARGAKRATGWRASAPAATARTGIAAVGVEQHRPDVSGAVARKYPSMRARTNPAKQKFKLSKNARPAVLDGVPAVELPEHPPELPEHPPELPGTAGTPSRTAVLRPD